MFPGNSAQHHRLRKSHKKHKRQNRQSRCNSDTNHPRRLPASNSQLPLRQAGGAIFAGKKLLGEAGFVVQTACLATEADDSLVGVHLLAQHAAGV